MRQMVKSAFFQRFLSYFKRKKEKKKIGGFSKASSGGQMNIFRLIGILPKITDRKNGERCTLFTEVCRTLNKKNKKKWSYHFQSFWYPSEYY